MSEATTTSIKTAVQHAIKMMDSGRLALAQEQVEEILRHYPDEVNSMRILAAIHREHGHVSKTVELLSVCTQMAPKFALAWQDLAFAQAASGLVDEALVSARMSTQLQPQLVISWRLLEELYLSLGCTRESELAGFSAIQYSANSDTLRAASRYFREGSLAKAEKLCREYLLKNKTDVSAIRLLAEIGMAIGVYDDAEILLARAITLEPREPNLRLQYARVLGKREKLNEAIAQLQLLEEALPDHPPKLLIKASLLIKLGQYESAISIYETLLRKFKPQANIYLNLGHALKTVGQVDQAIEAYQSAISLKPTLGEAYWSLANLKTFKFTESLIDQMEQVLRDESLPETEVFHLCFALGKAYEDQKVFEKSFAHYVKGNQIKKRLEAYQSSDTTENVDRQITSFKTPMIAPAELRHGQDIVPIFVLGLPRSGSTLVEQILASHSKVEATKELHDIAKIARRIGGKKKKQEISKYPECLQSMTQAELLTLGNKYLEMTAIHRQEGKSYFIDKMPNNWLHIGLIKLILPQAKIIDIRRQPMGACFSNFKQLFARGQSFTYGLEDIGLYYRDYLRMMTHWNAVLPEQIHQLNYETLVSDTETEIKKILAYCGLPFEQNCVEFHKTERAVKTPSAEQVRQPIYHDATEQWLNYRPYLKELEEVLADVL